MFYGDDQTRADSKIIILESIINHQDYDDEDDDDDDVLRYLRIGAYQSFYFRIVKKFIELS